MEIEFVARSGDDDGDVAQHGAAGVLAVAFGTGPSTGTGTRTDDAQALLARCVGQGCAVEQPRQDWTGCATDGSTTLIASRHIAGFDVLIEPPEQLPG